jgi:hypothetical protein
MGGDQEVSTAFLPPNTSCCCQKELNNWNIISDPQDISELKSDPNYVFRGNLQCSTLKQNSINQKNKVTGNIQGTVRENAKDGDGTKRNRGSGRGDTGTSTLNLECTCSSNGPFFDLTMTGGFNGAYTYNNGSVDPYNNVPFDLVVPSIVFLCDGAGTSMQIWSQYAYGSNVTEDPEEEFPVNNLISQGSINLNIFGQAISINLPYNTWAPSWRNDENFNGSYTARATINLTRGDC